MAAARIPNNSPLFEEEKAPEFRTYYWGEINDEKAIKILEGQSPGRFIIRYNLSQQKNVIDFVGKNGAIRHILLFYDNPGEYRIENASGVSKLENTTIAAIIKTYDSDINPFPHDNPEREKERIGHHDASRAMTNAYAAYSGRPTGRMANLVNQTQALQRFKNAFPTVGYDAAFEVVKILPELRVIRLNPLVPLIYDVPVVNCTKEQAHAYIETNPTVIIFGQDATAPHGFVAWKPDRGIQNVITQDLKLHHATNRVYSMVIGDRDGHFDYDNRKNIIELGTGRKFYGYPNEMRAYLHSINKPYTEKCGVIFPEGTRNPFLYVKRADNATSCSVMGGRYRKRGTMHRKKSRKHRSRRQRK